LPALADGTNIFLYAFKKIPPKGGKAVFTRQIIFDRLYETSNIKL
jgi:hypothetical protein